MTDKIDIVYTYVTYNDPKWQETYLKYSNNKNSVRFNSSSELELSVKHTLKYCSFVNNIYIVTDNQIPTWYNKDKYKNIKIVSHQEIFDDFCVYPTYNSKTIECYLHKIPGLTENFLYLNDDMFINLKIEDIFDKETGIPLSFYWPRNWQISPDEAKEKYRNNPAVYAIYTTIKMAEEHFKKDFNLSYTHQAYILSKKACELTWSIFRDRLQEKVKMRFRKHLSPDDLVPSLLSNIVSSEKGLSKFVDINKSGLSRLFFNCNKHNVHKLDDIAPGKYNFLCINDVNASDEMISKKFNAFSTNFLKELNFDL